MRSKRVTRYYCDHCARGGFKAPAMARHEQVCFSNPTRECPECGEKKTDVKANSEFLKAQSKYPSLSEAGAIEATREHVHNCPACLMSAVLMHNRENPDDFIYYGTYAEDMAEWRHENFLLKTGQA